MTRVDAARADLRALFTDGWAIDALVRFHTAHKLTLMAHAPATCRDLGRVVGRARDLSRDDIVDRYSAGFMKALSARATRAGHTNALQHAAGYLKWLDRASAAALHKAIEDYRLGRVARSVPLGLIRRHVVAQGIAYLAGQRYVARRPWRGFSWRRPLGLPGLGATNRQRSTPSSSGVR